MTVTQSVQILAFDGMEVLDYAGPYEVFNVAGEEGDGRFTVSSVGVTNTPTGRGGFRVVADFALEAAPPTDILIIPGGQGTRTLTHDTRVLSWLRERAAHTPLVLTVCTGALLAAAAGLLDGLETTTHHSAFTELTELAPATSVVPGRRFVHSSDHIRTAAGISAGIDLSLTVVEELAGVELRTKVEETMEWMWPDRKLVGPLTHSSAQ